MKAATLKKRIASRQKKIELLKKQHRLVLARQLNLEHSISKLRKKELPLLARKRILEEKIDSLRNMLG